MAIAVVIILVMLPLTIQTSSLAMVSPHTKFEVSTITFNEEMKNCNVKCKNFCFEPPFGTLGVTHSVYLGLDGKHTVDFLLVIIELSSLAVTAEALSKQNLSKLAFSEGVGHFECKF